MNRGPTPDLEGARGQTAAFGNELSAARRRGDLLVKLAVALNAGNDSTLVEVALTGLGELDGVHHAVWVGSSTTTDCTPNLRLLELNRQFPEVGIESLVWQVIQAGEALYLHASSQHLALVIEPVRSAFNGVVGALLLARDFKLGELEPDLRALLAAVAALVGVAVERDRHASDTAALRVAERALQESEIRRRLALEAARLGDWDLDLVNQSATRSQEHDRIFGYATPPTAWNFELFLSHVDPEDRSQVNRRFAGAMERGENWEFECRINRADGRPAWIWAQGLHVLNASGTPSHLIGVVQDITQRKNSEALHTRLVAELEFERSRLMAVLEQMPVAVWIAEAPTGKIVLGNSQSERTLGYPYRASSAIEGYSLDYQGFHQDGRRVESHEWPLARALNGETIQSEELQLSRADGSRVWLNLSAAPILDSSGRIQAAVVAGQDVTERRDLLNRLGEVNELQKRFVADAAHELRAPLTAIRGNLSLLQRFNVSDAERDEILGDVHRESERLSRLVADLLDMARGDGAGGGRREPVNFSATLLEAWRVSRGLSERHQFVLGELGAVTVMGDADRLKQLALILLENAIKYTPAGGSVRLSTNLRPDRVEFTVADSGPGIADQDLPHIFERFYRAERGRAHGDDPGGTGLGLPIAQLIVDRHGGEISVQSELGRGTAFTVWLPLAQR